MRRGSFSGAGRAENTEGQFFGSRAGRKCGGAVFREPGRTEMRRGNFSGACEAAAFSKGGRSMNSCIYESPIGFLELREENGALTRLYLLRDQERRAPQKRGEGVSGLLSEACRQLDEYFAGERRTFELPLLLSGTAFQRSVWEELRKIPYGATRSYEDIAAGIGNKKAVRAVGQANNRNPVMIVVPCHRVIHKNGDIAGFGCGTAVKKYLLELESGRK